MGINSESSALKCCPKDLNQQLLILSLEGGQPQSCALIFIKSCRRGLIKIRFSIYLHLGSNRIRL